MEKIYVDTDVIMDFLIDKKPYGKLAAKIFTYAEKGEVDLCVSALSFSKIYYVSRKFVEKIKALELLNRLEKIVRILPVDEKIIKQALTSDFKDFEDAIQNYTAKQIKEIKVIVTRNVKDYSKSDLAIYTPESYLKKLERKK